MKDSIPSFSSILRCILFLYLQKIILIDAFRISTTFTSRQQHLQNQKVVKRSERRPHKNIILQTSTSPNEESETDDLVRLEDRGVPEAHQGLHDALYGDNEDHGASKQGTTAQDLPKYDEEIMPVAQVIEQCSGKSVAALYGVLDIAGQVKYVGITRNLAVSLNSHLSNLGQRIVHSVCVTTFKYPKKEEMLEMRTSWLKELGYTPVGNTKIGRAQWAETVAEASKAGMSENEIAAYEANKTKMRKAMADTTLIDEMDQLGEDEKLRRQNIINAVEGDNWSGEIDRQSQEAVASYSQGPMDDITSPFDENAPVEETFETPVATECKDLELTQQNVDKVLEEVRPYLIADGGNIKVVSIEQDSRNINVALQGACGTCPSSTMTMQMGVERVLRENFANLGQIVAVEDPLLSVKAELTKELVDGILDQIRPAIKAMGGYVNVESALGGVVQLKYKGPEKIKYGIELSLTDNDLINQVEFLDDQ